MSDGVLQRLTTALAGRYRIERELGAGGMATVFLAHDERHDRRVALKVLKPELAAVIGAERFLGEIKTTANLQHPHILALFDSGTVDGTVFYAMPFVDGETLRDRLARETQLPIEDALRIASEVADALQYAHEHGVIHRDIKPENILLQGGHALVADFGIALAASTIGGTRMTETGMSLGTPTYMSPEQAMGERALDARTDLYALGCVLYEMLVGEAPFTGPTAQAVVAKVMTEKPAGLRARRDRVPPHVEEAVLTALEKLPADRFTSAGEFARALARPSATAARVSDGPRAHMWRSPRLAATLVALTALALVGGWALGRRTTPTASVTRYQIQMGSGLAPSVNAGNHFAWSADGRVLAMVATNGAKTGAWLRAIDSLEASFVTGSDNASSVVFSPDGTRLAFVVTAPFSLNVVPRGGGKPTKLLDNGSAMANDAGKLSGGGLDWASDDWIYFDGATALSRIRPDGTHREDLFVLDPAKRELGLAWPQAVPEQHMVLVRVRHVDDDLPDYVIEAFDVKSRTRKVVVKAVFAQYLPSGHLLYVTSDGTLMASRYDAARRELTGVPVAIARGIALSPFGAADFAVSSTGTLLYVVGHATTWTVPHWVGRDGRAAPVDPQLRQMIAFDAVQSPDGSRIAFYLSGVGTSTASRTEDIWIKSLPSGPLSRLTFEGEQNAAPAWSRDGRDVLFVSSRAGIGALYRQSADGSTPAVRIASLQEGIGRGIESPDGEWLVLQADEATTRGRLYVMHRGVDKEPRPILASPFAVLQPSLSPDGKWLAYQSDETGRAEVYVRPFPEVESGKTQVSTGGGQRPRWSPKGDEIFFEAPSFDLMAARVKVSPTFSVLGQQSLFPLGGFAPAYDVSPDAKRFLLLRRVAGSELGAENRTIVVENFVSELGRLLR